jgi:hypothetical protein
LPPQRVAAIRIGLHGGKERGAEDRADERLLEPERLHEWPPEDRNE